MIPAYIGFVSESLMTVAGKLQKFRMRAQENAVPQSARLGPGSSIE